MARANKCNPKIRVQSFATCVTHNKLNMEDVQICVDEDEDIIDRTTMSVAQGTTKNSQDGATEVSHLFRCDTELKEEYKQLLVNAVAERMKHKMPEVEIWKKIQEETDYDHRGAWVDMRNTTMKKIKNLLPANDLLVNIPMEMQLSASEWLLFDLILVHENINVINIDSLENIKNEEPPCLHDLLEIVKQYDIESLTGKALIEAWKCLTLEYNSRGRQCSPMMLQLRWYQLKQLTRNRFKNSYSRNNSRDVQNTLQSNVVVEVTVLQIAIAVACHEILSEDCPTWETLIDERRVILAEEFSQTNSVQDNTAPTVQVPNLSDAPPVLLLKLDGKQMAIDFEKIKNTKKSNIATDDTIIIDLKDDAECATALQNIMNKGTEPKEHIAHVEINNVEDEFKQRLVKEMVTMLRKKKPDKRRWLKLKKKLKRDCKEVWYQMQDATIRKILGLLAADDFLQDITAAMRLTHAEWLLFDLVLVHGKINVVNVNTLDATCLRDLFELVKEFQVENLVEEALVEAWIHLTLKYNRKGRQCSPMLLQLRWYQLKEMSRQQVYKPSMLLNRYKSKMLIAIATKYQKIITESWSNWSTRVQEKTVVLHEDFITALKQKEKWKNVEAREGWYLHVKEVIYDTPGNITEIDKCNSEDQFNGILQNTLKMPTQLMIPKLNYITESEIIELDSDEEINEILREKANNLLNISQEKATNILQLQPECAMGEKSKNHENSQQVVYKPVKEVSISNEPILCDSDDEIDKLLQEKANLLSIGLPKNFKTLEKIISSEIDEFRKVKTSEEFGMEVEEAGIIKNELLKLDYCGGLDEIDFDDNNVEFVDDGIKFEEGSEYKTKKVGSRAVYSSDTDSVSNLQEDVDESQIDLKLLMNTSVYTKKIDCMEVFKFIDYESVNDKRVIECVESESKPMHKHAPNDTDIENFRTQMFSEFDKDHVKSDDDMVEAPDIDIEKCYKESIKPGYNYAESASQSAENRVKYTSWLLQKPKKRKYKSKQLYKNPDFNTDIKALTLGFLSAKKNRVLLKKCQPITIDVHKAFEKKLVNGTMYLKHGNFKSAKFTKMENIRNNEKTISPPLIPGLLTNEQHMKLSEYVRNLIATMTTDKQDEGDLQMSNITAKVPMKRSKVINLPDKDQIRLINQSLLTAEITPRHQPLLNIPAINTTSDEKPVMSLPTIIATKNFDSSELGVISSEESPNKRLKTPEPRSQTSYCCWAREKIISTQENLHLNCSEHQCVENCCTCCCLQDLILHTKKQDKRKPSHSLLKCPEPSKVVWNSIQNERKINYTSPLMTKANYSEIHGTNIVVLNRNSEDNRGSTSYSPNILDSSRILNYTIEPKTAIKKDVCTKIKENPTKSINNVIMSNKREAKSKPIPPLRKIAPRLTLNTSQMFNSPTYLTVPPGVNFIKLADENVAVAINPGVQLEPQQLHALMSVCATVNKSTLKTHN